jgi:predicted SAM-dependent methyltransferase
MPLGQKSSFFAWKKLPDKWAAVTLTVPTRLFHRFRNSYKLRQVRMYARHSVQTTANHWKRLDRRLRLPSEISKRNGLHIHFGCGEINDPRFINVDARPFSHVHLIDHSPMLRAFRDNSADSVYACHVFEHFIRAKTVGILRRWLVILKPGGRLLLSVPDFDKLCDIYHRADRQIESIEPQLMGGQDYSGNFHYAIFNRSHLTDLLNRAGFIDIAEWHPSNETSWPKDYSWDDCVSLNMSGRKPI